MCDVLGECWGFFGPPIHESSCGGAGDHRGGQEKKERKEGRKEGLRGGAGGTRTAGSGSGSSALGKYVSRARHVTECFRFVRTQTCAGAGQTRNDITDGGSARPGRMFA